jgi:hypothetical protein
VDAATAKPVKARVEYMGTADNPHVSGLTDELWPYGSPLTNEQGEFAIVVPPGPGALAVWTQLASDVPDRYRPAAPEDYGLPVQDDGWIATANHGYISPVHYKAAKFINFQPGEVPPNIDLKVSPITDVVRVRCIDPAGQALSDISVVGHLPWSGDTPVIPHGGLEEGQGADTYIEIAELGAESRKPVVFRQSDRKLAAILFPSRDTRKPRLANLAQADDGAYLLPLTPSASIIGRLVDADGNPVRAVSIELLLPTESGARGVPIARPYVNDQGRFEQKGVPTDHSYLIAIGGAAHRGIFRRDLQLAAGEQLDLGDIDVSQFEIDPKREAREVREKPIGKIEIHGRVIASDGTPKAGAHVAVIGNSARQRRGGDLDYRDEVLAETTTNANGAYELTITSVSSKTHHYFALIARADGAALAWRRLNLEDKVIEASLELAAEEPIRGRLVDIEGQPAAGVRLSIGNVLPTTTNGENVTGAGYRKFSDPPDAWPQSMTTDSKGQFVIHGIPAGHGVYIEVEGSERFAPQQILLNTGRPKLPGEHALVKNFKPGEEAVLALSPAQIFEGTVRYEDTGQPAPFARLTIWAAQENYTTMRSVAGKADAQGRYRINPTPGIRFGVKAYAPDSAPYLTRDLRDIDWDDSAKVKQVDMTLPRGVLVRGKVVESSSGATVAGATIQYVPEELNNPNYKDDILTGWQGIQLSNAQGEFEIVVLPGPGNLLVHGPQGEFVLKETSSRELYRGRPGGQRNYANAIRRIDPAAGAEQLELTIELVRSAKIVGRLVNESGEPVDEALLISQLNVSPTDLWWRSDASKQVLGGRFELSGMTPNQECTAYFLDAKRRLGATINLIADGTTPTVVLKPCGQATARFVDEDGQPLENLSPSIHMVVTPGPHELDNDAAARGELAADHDFVSNIDATNYRPALRTDSDGRLVYPCLIPGATYRFIRYDDGKSSIVREFRVESGQEIDLGEIVISQD